MAINAFIPRIGPYESLSEVPTRLLLKWRKLAYRYSGGGVWRSYYCPSGDERCNCQYKLHPLPDDAIGYDPTENGGSVITLADLKGELAKRPHIPSKLEGKRLRREAAKRKQ